MTKSIIIGRNTAEHVADFRADDSILDSNRKNPLFKFLWRIAKARATLPRLLHKEFGECSMQSK